MAWLWSASSILPKQSKHGRVGVTMRQVSLPKALNKVFVR